MGDDWPGLVRLPNSKSKRQAFRSRAKKCVSMIEERPEVLTDRRLVGVVCRKDRPEIEPIARKVVDFLQSQRINVCMDTGSCQGVSNGIERTEISEMDVDFVVTIGGDGTILYALSQLKDRQTPLFCINRGTVGFLTETGPETAVSHLQKAINNECVIEQNVNIDSGAGDRSFDHALNEVYVVSATPGRLLTFLVYLDGIRVDFGRADGAMVATPTGSTAYALAAGGSILTPGVHGLIFVPVCPPRFELKSLVIPDDSLIEIELVKQNAPGLAVIDGQSRWAVEPKETVWARKAEGVTRFIRQHDNYYDRLNTRLVPRTL